MRSVIPIVGLAILAAATPVQPGATGPSEDAPPARVIQIRATDAGGGQWRFIPDAITARPGDVVRFIQDDIVPHNVQFKDVPQGTDLGSAVMGPFMLQKGDTYEIEVDQRFAPGVHQYVCTPHEMMGMTGTIEVLPPTEPRHRRQPS